MEQVAPYGSDRLCSEWCTFCLFLVNVLPRRQPSCLDLPAPPSIMLSQRSDVLWSQGRGQDRDRTQGQKRVSCQTCILSIYARRTPLACCLSACQTSVLYAPSISHTGRLVPGQRPCSSLFLSISHLTRDDAGSSSLQVLFPMFRTRSPDSSVAQVPRKEKSPCRCA